MEISKFLNDAINECTDRTKEIMDNKNHNNKLFCNIKSIFIELGSIVLNTVKVLCDFGRSAAGLGARVCNLIHRVESLEEFADASPKLNSIAKTSLRVGKHALGIISTMTIGWVSPKSNNSLHHKLGLDKTRSFFNPHDR